MEDNAAAQLLSHGLSVHRARLGTFVDFQQVLSGYEADARLALHVLDKLAQHAVAALRLLGRSPVGLHPGLARGIGAVGEIYRVPKLRGYELRGVVVDADEPAAARAEPPGSVVEQP